MDPLVAPRKGADLTDRERALLSMASLHLQSNQVVARGTVPLDDALFIAEQIRAGRIKDVSHAIARGFGLLRRVMEQSMDAEARALDREFEL